MGKPKNKDVSVISRLFFSTEMSPFSILWPHSSRAPGVDPVKGEPGCFHGSSGRGMLLQEGGTAASEQFANCPL